jgi:hypothetical protein
MHLLYKDIEILIFLYEYGPASTSEIQQATSCTSGTSTIERLWTLMAVNRDVDSLDRPLIDKDAKTNEWGAPEDVGTTVRGWLPTERGDLTDKLTDELIRRLLDAGVARPTLFELFDCSRRATFHMEKRAGALCVPIADDTAQQALMDEDEFDQLVAGLSHLLRSVDDVHDNQ